MSKATLDLLNTIGLLSHDKVIDLTSFDDVTLGKLQNYYYTQRSRDVNIELNDLRRDQSLSSLVSSFSAQNAVLPLLPSFLIHEHLITDDPLFRMCVPKTEMSMVHKQAMGVDTNNGIDRVVITNNLHYFSMLAPLIRANLLTVLPLKMLHLPPEHPPIFCAEDRFRSEIPENIHEFIHKRAVVQPVVLNRETGALIILRKPAKEPCRAISISFEGDYPTRSLGIYFFQTMQAEGVDQDTDRIKVNFSWAPDEPLAQDIFDGWVYQSINRTIIQRLGDISSELRLAESLNHSYTTESQFESALLSQCGFRGEEPSSQAINFLRANETLIQIPSPEEMVRLREKHAEAFSRFRANLLCTSEALQGTPPAQFCEKAERLYRTEIQPQVDEIEKSVRTVCTSLGKGALVSLGSVAFAIASGTALPLVAASLYVTSGTITESLPALLDYMSSRKRPEFFWKQLRR